MPRKKDKDADLKKLWKDVKKQAQGKKRKKVVDKEEPKEEVVVQEQEVNEKPGVIGRFLGKKKVTERSESHPERSEGIRQAEVQGQSTKESKNKKGKKKQVPEKVPKPLVLAICDGWGVAPKSEGNPIAHAKLPNFNSWITQYPVMTIVSSSTEVGLSWGEMGNSEVGHLNIGAGRVYYQTLPRITKEVAGGEFFENEVLKEAMKKAKGSRLHLMGIVSAGNVHGAEDHCHALLDMAKRNGVDDVFVHAFLDGRDSAKDSAKKFITRLQEKMKEFKTGQIASLCGRYWAMDRDNRWDRIEKAYNAIALGKADEMTEDPVKAIENSYAKEVFDEEFVPTVVQKGGKPVATIEKGDVCIFFNFRPDRARQITKAFTVDGFKDFSRDKIADLHFVTMAEYEAGLPVKVVYPPVVIKNCLAEVLSKNKKKQFHIAETEKYAHVTFFLNGTIEDPFPGEDRKIVPSPKVKSYAEKPEMSADGVAKETAKAIKSKKYDVIILNFANADMVAHTGDNKATKVAVEAVDKALATVWAATEKAGGMLMMTADHGNGEELKNLRTGEMDKEHSTNPIPFLIMSKSLKGEAGPTGLPPGGDLSKLPPVGMLADVAPTMLKALQIEQPPEMTGRALM